MSLPACLLAWLPGRPGYMVDWLAACLPSLAAWLLDWLVGWVAEWLAGWLICWLAWLAGWLAGHLLVDWLAWAWLAGCMHGWLSLVGCFGWMAS